MATIRETLAIAVEHHQAGRLPAAEELYRQVLAVDPREPNAWHLLGVLSAQLGRYATAVDYLRRAIAILPDWADALGNLGRALFDQRRFNEAAAAQRRVIELQPGSADGYANLARTVHAQGRLDEAVACYRQALQRDPASAATCVTLGSALQARGNLEEAAACYRQAVRLRPDFAVAHTCLGLILQMQGKFDEAVASHRRALDLSPELAAAHANLGLALQKQGKFAEAAASHRRALELSPGLAAAHTNLGNVLQIQGRLDEAVASHRRALELCPELPAAHDSLGLALAQQAKSDEAAACHRRALQLKPDFAQAHHNLGVVLVQQGRSDEAVASFQHALKLKPDFVAACSGLLYSLQYHAGTTPSELAAAHAEFDRLHARPLRNCWRPHENVRDTWRRLRLGFVSPDFGRHPVGHFLVPVLENLDRGRCETFCYCDRTLEDDMTARIRAAAAQWRDVVGLDHETLAEQIRDDRIDVLFDLAGHTAGNRLLLFARKPAPIQITWLGYEGTTGLEAMDFILGDRWTIPTGEEGYYRERVLRMPDSYVCYDPPGLAAEPGPLPAAHSGHVRLASFNNLAKITPEVVEVWSRILHRVPQSRLVLKYRGLGEQSERERYQGMFAASGVDPSRLELLPWSDYAEYYAALRTVDIALDPFPFGGGVTTCNTLWMGVPVVTCPGDTFAGRHGLSHLSNVGLAETIAKDFEQYVEIAVGLANDLPRLAAIRAGLRERMAASPLCDGRRFAENFAHVIRGAWREWCEKGD